ncbi:E3 ubiquitin-protein ligase RNF168 [Pelodiscus sinensis]|uniref:E3 ubiquitin-protein ligase RNF168 n=1 Tax=Pelodiscus sinensis TaxID=13735 RepID=UPI003F6C71C9
MSKKDEAPLSLTDCLCQICMEIFVEPVTLPCNHTLCNSCFQSTVEKASLYCPFCRRRVSSWARYNARKNTLINWELWERIQKNYPEECQRRVNGQDLEEDLCISQPLHQLSKPGELRQEYEAEISKVEAERRAHEQEESKVSEEYIQRLLAEEEEEHRLAEERQRELEEQLKQDEVMAWELSLRLNKSTDEHMFSTPLRANRHASSPSPINSCKTKSKSSNSGDIQKYLSPKPSRVLVPQSLSKKAEKDRNSSCSMENNSTEEDILMWQKKDSEEMPTLSPQTTCTVQDRSVNDSFLESCLTYLNTSPPVTSPRTNWEGLPGSNYQVDKITNALHNITKQGRADPGLPCSSGDVARSALDNDNSTCTANRDSEKCAEGSSSLWEAAVSAVSGKLENRDAAPNFMEVAANCSVEGREQNVLQSNKEAPKRKSQEPPTEAAIDSCLMDKRRKTSPETYEDQEEKVNDLNMQVHIDLEKQLYERLKQEEQDRLLALQLQREIDKEQKMLNRKKGSPDEYLLRPKSSPSPEESPTAKGSHKMASDSTSPKNQSEMSRRKLRRSSHNENRQPSSKLQMKSPSVRGKVLNCVNSCDSKDIQSLLTKNKQNTILQMFKRPVSK